MLNKLLRLERPLGVLDLETTGLNPDKDFIIQIALTIHYPHRDPIAWVSLINPGIPIENCKHHKITNEDVKDAPTFRSVAPALAPKIINIDICGYNVDFDIKFMRSEMRRAQVDWPWNGHIIDPMHIYRLKYGHNLTNAYKQYVNAAGFQGAHDAGNDVKATEEVLVAQLNLHQDLPRTVKELAAFCHPKDANSVDSQGRFVWVGNDCAFNFGKHRGKLLKSVDRDYLVWILGGDFSEEVKVIVKSMLDGAPITKTDMA